MCHVYLGGSTMYGPHITASESWVMLEKIEEHCQRLEVSFEALCLGIGRGSSGGRSIEGSWKR